MRLIIHMLADLYVLLPYMYMHIYTLLNVILTFITCISIFLAVKEFAFMKALHAHGFPTPTPIDQSRHIVAMSKIEGKDVHDYSYFYPQLP